MNYKAQYVWDGMTQDFMEPRRLAIGELLIESKQHSSVQHYGSW